MAYGVGRAKSASALLSDIGLVRYCYLDTKEEFDPGLDPMGIDPESIGAEEAEDTDASASDEAYEKATAYAYE